jgi:hypothetical protein
MRIATDFVLLGAVGATFLFDRAILLRRQGWTVDRKGIHLIPTPMGVSKLVRQRIHWIDAQEFARLIRSDPELVIFRLNDGLQTEIKCDVPPGVVAVTLGELEKTIPWIPLSSRIVIYRAGGIGASLAKDLVTILQGRDVMFFAEDAEPMIAG